MAGRVVSHSSTCPLIHGTFHLSEYSVADACRMCGVFEAENSNLDVPALIGFYSD